MPPERVDVALAEAAPGFEMVGWFGLVAPRGTPAEIIKRLNAELDAALEDKAVREGLALVGFRTKGAGSPQEMASFGPRWSDDRQLWFRPTEAGASFTVEVPVERAGRYRLVGYFTKAIDYGQVQLSLDGTDVGKPFEGFNDGVIHSGPVEIGTVELTGGTHRLKFTVTGKHPRSTGYLVGVDAVELTPLP